MVDHRLVEHLFRPFDGVRIGALAGEEQRVHRADVVLLEQRRLRVLLAHGAERGRRGEEGADLVFLDHPPERAGVRRADRLAFVEDGRAAVQQRRVDDVGMADDPADVGGGPVGLAGLDVVDRRHRPFERDDIAADVAHHALRHAGRPRGVEDVERIGRREIGAGRALAGGLGGADQRRPVVVAVRIHPRLDLRALEHDRPTSAWPCDRPIARSSRGLYSTIRPGSMPQLAVRITFGSASSMRVASSLAAKPPNTTEWIGADAGAGEHGHDRFGDHRHVDQDAIAGDDAEILKDGGERRGLVEQLPVGDRPLRPGHRAVVVDRRLFAASRLPHGGRWRCSRR